MADERDETREHRDAAMQRVRVGITGLATVFLLTLLAASIFSFLGQDDRTIRLTNGAVVANGQAAADPPKEPLAELGVAPGGNTPGTTPAPRMTGNPPMLTLSPPTPALSNPSNAAAPAQH
jgi:hypothetical protein